MLNIATEHANMISLFIIRFLDSIDLVRHKPGCTASGDGYMLGISDFRSRGIILPM